MGCSLSEKIVEYSGGFVDEMVSRSSVDEQRDSVSFEYEHEECDEDDALEKSVSSLSDDDDELLLLLLMFKFLNFELKLFWSQ